MIPVVTPEEMGAVDRAAPEPVEVLIERAGAAVARAAVALMGGTYGRRVVVIAGKGNNGNDGRAAARRLRRRGVRVHVVDPGVRRVDDCDLVIDAAFGTGFRGEYAWPSLPVGVPVLAVDIPSGVDGTTGAVAGVVPPARRTVTFAALKPGLLFEPGASLAGEVVVADIGLDVGSARAHVVEEGDVASWLPSRAPTTNKWRSAVRVVAGSAGMAGAAALVSSGALRAGAGYVRESSPGVPPGRPDPVEAVQVPLPAEGWAPAVLADLDRFGSLVVGNGLGTAPGTQGQIREVVTASKVPVVVDADGLTALAAAPAPLTPMVVLTPHDGEFARLAGHPPGEDRVADARALAARTGAIVLLKGATTIVAHPSGRALFATAGSPRLATAGTGDVLSGMVGAFLARGLDGLRAAALAAHVHGRAASFGPPVGLVAGDLPDLVPRALTAPAESVA